MLPTMLIAPLTVPPLTNGCEHQRPHSRKTQPGMHQEQQGREQLWTENGSEWLRSACVSTYCHRYMACRRLRLPSCGLNLDPEGKHPDAVTISRNM